MDEGESRERCYVDNFTDDVFDKLFMDNNDGDSVKDAKEDGDAIPPKENKRDKKDVQYYSMHTRCLDLRV